MRAQCFEDLLLDVLVLGGGFDDQVMLSESGKALDRRDSPERCRLNLFAHLSGFDLPGDVVADGGEPCGDALRAHVVEANLEPCKGADMGNARTHLSGANDADFADFHLGFLIKSIQKSGKA